MQRLRCFSLPAALLLLAVPILWGAEPISATSAGSILASRGASPFGPVGAVSLDVPFVETAANTGSQAFNNVSVPLDLISTSAITAPDSSIRSGDAVFSDGGGSDYATFVAAMESPDYGQMAEIAAVPETSTWVAAALGALILFPSFQKGVTALRRRRGARACAR